MSERASGADRRALKREYKESHRPAGIYQLRNTVSGRILVGSSVNLPATWNKLRMQLEHGTHPMYPELSREWKELGASAFVFEVLEELEPEDSPDWDPRPDLEALEALYLEQLSPYGECGYNRQKKR